MGIFNVRHVRENLMLIVDYSPFWNKRLARLERVFRCIWVDVDELLELLSAQLFVTLPAEQFDLVGFNLFT